MPLPTNASTLLATFQKAGYTPAQAAGILGNLRKEGGPNIDPAIKDPSGRSLGVAQWLNERRTGLENYAKGVGKSATDLQTQADYLVRELNTTEKTAGDLLKKTRSPTEAAQVFQREYERPKVLDRDRAVFANQYYNDVNKYYNQATGQSKPTAPPPVSGSSGNLVDKAKAVAESSVQAAQRKAQELIQQTLDKMKAIQSGQTQSYYDPSSSSSGNDVKQIANASWDQAYLDASSKIKAAQANIDSNIAKNYNPTTNAYSNIASSAFPGNYSNTLSSNNIASNAFGNTFGNTFDNTFGNSFG